MKFIMMMHAPATGWEKAGIGTWPLEDVKAQHPGRDVEEPFTRGYQRGRDYYQRLCDEKRAA